MPLHGGEAAYYEHHNSPVRSKKRKRAAQEEKAALKLGVRKDRPLGHRGPDAKRAKQPFYSKKEGCPKGRRQPTNTLRQNSRFGVGLKRPNQKRANHQFVPKKRGGLLYGSSPPALVNKRGDQQVPSTRSIR